MQLCVVGGGAATKANSVLKMRKQKGVYDEDRTRCERHCNERMRTLAFSTSDSWLSFLLPERVSPAFWVVDFSPWGCKVEAAESAVPLRESPNCSEGKGEKGKDRSKSIHRSIGDGKGERTSGGLLGIRLESRASLVGEGLTASVRHDDL